MSDTIDRAVAKHLEYYLRVAYGPQRVWFYPGVAQDLLGTPYFVVRREGVDVVR